MKCCFFRSHELGTLKWKWLGLETKRCGHSAQTVAPRDECVFVLGIFTHFPSRSFLPFHLLSAFSCLQTSSVSFCKKVQLQSLLRSLTCQCSFLLSTNLFYFSVVYRPVTHSASESFYVSQPLSICHPLVCSRSSCPFASQS